MGKGGNEGENVEGLEVREGLKGDNVEGLWVREGLKWRTWRGYR